MGFGGTAPQRSRHLLDGRWGSLFCVLEVKRLMLGITVQGFVCLEVKVCVLRFGVEGVGFRVWGFGFWVENI